MNPLSLLSVLLDIFIGVSSGLKTSKRRENLQLSSHVNKLHSSEIKAMHNVGFLLGFLYLGVHKIVFEYKRLYAEIKCASKDMCLINVRNLGIPSSYDNMFFTESLNF